MTRHAAARLTRGSSLMAQALAFALAASWLSPDANAQRKYSEWGPAVSLGCGLNSEAAEVGPAISKDGLSLYFGSSRGGGFGNFDLYVAQRASPDAAWGLPANLGNVVNTSAIDNVPSLSRDEHWLFFNSSRPGGFGMVDIWMSYRAHVHDDFAWEAPINLGSDINTGGFDSGASYFENEDGAAPQLFFNRGLTNLGNTDILVSELKTDGTFGTPTSVRGTDINTPAAEQRPSVRFDGLEMFFYSNRDGNNDIWVTTRNSVSDEWSKPVKLTQQTGTPAEQQINTPSNEIAPHISPDGLTLYFSSDRPGGCGNYDIYMSRRTHLRGKDKE